MDDIDNVFLLPGGKKVVKISNIIRFMESELKVEIPSATEVRKIGATAVAKKCTEGEARVVARQMAHDPRTTIKPLEVPRMQKMHLTRWKVSQRNNGTVSQLLI